jgi:hypothetical protein
VVLNSSCDAASGLIQGTISGAISQAALDVTCTCLVLGPELSDEACGVLSTEGTGSDACAGCVGEMPDGTSKPFVSLNAIMPALNGGQPLLFECEDDQGGPAACLTATFDASRLPEKPEPCL